MCVLCWDWGIEKLSSRDLVFCFLFLSLFFRDQGGWVISCMMSKSQKV